MKPRVSVVLPVFNAGTSVLAVVERLRAQTLAPAEIIVVDDGSTDDTPEALARIGEEVVIVRKDNGGPASARNAGIRVARSELVAFTDSDCLPEPEWLEKLAAAFDGPDVAGAGGTVRAVGKGVASDYAARVRLLDPPCDARGTPSSLVTANACFRRLVLLEVGVFDDRFRKPGGEELELSRRIRSRGYTLRFVPEAVVLHEHQPSVRSFLRTIANYGEGHYVLATIWPEYRLRLPMLGLVCRLLAVPLLVRAISRYLRDTKPTRAVSLGVVDFLYLPAFLYGYVRGRRADPRE